MCFIKNLGQRFGTSKMHLISPSGLGCCPFSVGGSVVVDSLLIVTPSVAFCNCSLFCCALLCAHSSFPIISSEKRELVALLCLSSWCLVIFVWLLLTMPRVCLPVVIMFFIISFTLTIFDLVKSGLGIRRSRVQI